MPTRNPLAPSPPAPVSGGSGAGLELTPAMTAPGSQSPQPPVHSDSDRRRNPRAHLVLFWNLFFRTLRKLGISPVAVYSEADRHSPHVALSDLTVLLGPPPAAQRYLNQQAILLAA